MTTPSHASRRAFLAAPAALGLLPALPALARLRPPPSRDILVAAAAGDLETVRALLDADPGLAWARDPVGRSVFALAMRGRHLEVGVLLRERGYRPDAVEAALIPDWALFDELVAPTPGLVNRPHPIGGTAMHAAAWGGAGPDMWRVYRYGADPNASPNGLTPLRAAFDYPDLAQAELAAAALLANGADPNLHQVGGSMPLHAAAARGSVELVEMLIRRGADIDVVDAGGRTPRDLAERAGHPGVVIMLDEHDRIPRTHSTSRRAYDAQGRPYRAPDLSHFSVETRESLVGLAHRSLEMVRTMVERDPRLVHAVATTTEGAVEAAGHMGQQAIVDYLLERGAPYSIVTATMSGDVDRVKSLLAEDPRRIDERGPHDFALLWYPIIGTGSTDLMELLLDAGADIERQHFLGTTALHWAVRFEEEAMVDLLLERGANPNRPGRKFGPTPTTPLDHARARENDRLVARLIAAGARG